MTPTTKTDTTLPAFTGKLTGLDLGAVTVDEGAQAFLLHPEHGAQGIGPGSYLVRRQREQADEIRMVQD